MEGRTLKLRTPIEFGSQTIEELTFRPGRLEDMKGLSIRAALAIDDVITIACRLSGQPTAVIGKLGAADAGEVIAIATDFYAACLTTGPTPSES